MSDRSRQFFFFFTLITSPSMSGYSRFKLKNEIVLRKKIEKTFRHSTKQCIVEFNVLIQLSQNRNPLPANRLKIKFAS